MKCITKFKSLLRFSTFALTLALLSTAALADHKPKHNPGGGGGGGDEEPPPELPSYSMTPLGTLGGDGSLATAINAWGDVVGWSETGETTSSGIPVEEPFVYFNNTRTMHRLRDLVTAEDQDFWIWQFHQPRGINGAGQISMQLSTNATGTHESHGVRITLAFDETGNVIPGEGIVEVVGPFAATGINEFGDVTGFDGEAWVYSDDFESGFVYIGDLGGGNSAGFAINDSGQVAGDSINVDGENRAFRFTPGADMEDLGVIEQFGSFEARSDGEDINDLGVVVGFATAGKHKGNQVIHAFREDGSGMEDLGALGGSGNWSWAYSINSDGWIIGESEVDEGSRREFLYADEFGMVELQPLIANLPEGATLIDAAQINDAGEIGATISYGDGTGEAVLLTPNP